jgi:hypothetical protein
MVIFEVFCFRIIEFGLVYFALTALKSCIKLVMCSNLHFNLLNVKNNVVYYLIFVLYFYQR